MAQAQRGATDGSLPRPERRRPDARVGRGGRAPPHHRWRRAPASRRRRRGGGGARGEEEGEGSGVGGGWGSGLIGCGAPDRAEEWTARIRRGGWRWHPIRRPSGMRSARARLRFFFFFFFCLLLPSLGIWKPPGMEGNPGRGLRLKDAGGDRSFRIGSLSRNFNVVCVCVCLCL